MLPINRKSCMGMKLLVAGLMLVMLVAFSAGLLAAAKITIQTPSTVGAIPLLWLKEEGKLGEEFELEIIISPDHNRAITLISNNEIDMMVTGVNVGAKVFNKGIDIKMLNTNIWAIDYLLTNGFKAAGWEDLKGKTLSLPLKGGPLDFLVRYLMIENGVEPEEVELVYLPLANGAKTFQLGNLDAIVLPEPLVTITLAKSEDTYLSFDLQQEWARLHNGEDRLPFVGLFASGQFIRNNQELVEEIKTLYQEGVQWVHQNPEKAAQLASTYFNMPANIIKASFKRVNLNCYPGGEAFRLIESYFGEILKMYPEMIGGQLPNEQFYF